MERHLSSFLLALAALLLLEGCAMGHSRGSLASGFGLHSRPTSLRDTSGPWQPAASPVLTEEQGGAGGFPEQTADPFQVVQEASGLDEEARHPVGAALYQEQARQLLGQLRKTRVTQRSFAPRRVLSWLLREVLAGGERVEYADLKWRAERFWLLVLVRPDGYLVAALTGTPIQRMGPLELVEGEWKVGGLEVGNFYFSRGGVFYPVTEALRRADSRPLAELGLGRDPLNAALDGAQDAMGEMAAALAQSILHPIRTVEELAQLPTTVALLIASSPEYFASYGAMSREDQIREAARLSTHVIVEEVEFDGFNGKALLEAKAGSYKHFLKKDGTAQPWFEAGKGFTGLMEQAEKQSRLAERLGLPLVWYVAEAEFANFLRKVFKEEGLGNITVRHTSSTR